MSDTPTDPSDVQAAREALARFDESSREILHRRLSGKRKSAPMNRHLPDAERYLRATLAHLDTLTARLAVVEGERDADVMTALMRQSEAFDITLAVVEGERETWVCACGLPMSRNPHPDAGKPAALLDVGAVWVCIPCTVKSRHGATTARFQAERDRDAAAATERAAIVADLRAAATLVDSTPPTDGFAALANVAIARALSIAAARYESNAHHETTK